MNAKMILVATTFLFAVVAVATPAHAVASCSSLTDPTCPGVYCSGYSNGHWGTCVTKPCTGPMYCTNPCDQLSMGCNPCNWFRNLCGCPGIECSTSRAVVLP